MLRNLSALKTEYQERGRKTQNPGKGRKMPGGWKREAQTSRISNDKLAAKLGLCQHVLPGSDSNDGLAHLPFISGKFSLHPVYYELAGICLIVFASTTRLAEIKALLLLPTKPCTPLLEQDTAQGGDQGWPSVTQSNSPHSHSPPETPSPEAARPQTKKSLLLQGSLSCSLHETSPPL